MKKGQWNIWRERNVLLSYYQLSFRKVNSHSICVYFSSKSFKIWFAFYLFLFTHCRCLYNVNWICSVILLFLADHFQLFAESRLLLFKPIPFIEKMVVSIFISGLFMSELEPILSEILFFSTKQTISALVITGTTEA